MFVAGVRVVEFGPYKVVCWLQQKIYRQQLKKITYLWVFQLKAKALGGKAKARASVCKTKAKAMDLKAKAKNFGLKANAKAQHPWDVCDRDTRAIYCRPTNRMNGCD